MDMLALQVNIIPIIAKADTIAKNELHKFKSKIMSELVSNGVQIYQFPTDEETVAEINATMSVSRQSSGEQREALQNACVVAASQRAGQACAGVFSSAVAASHLTSQCLSFPSCQVGKRVRIVLAFCPPLFSPGSLCDTNLGPHTKPLKGKSPCSVRAGRNRAAWLPLPQYYFPL